MCWLQGKYLGMPRVMRALVFSSKGKEGEYFVLKRRTFFGGVEEKLCSQRFVLKRKNPRTSAKGVLSLVPVFSKNHPVILNLNTK